MSRRRCVRNKSRDAMNCRKYRKENSVVNDV